MTPLSVVHSPPAPATGRPAVGGTVLATPSGLRLVLVREVYDLAENTAGTGSPRVAVWVGLCGPGEIGMTPVVVRGTKMPDPSRRPRSNPNRNPWEWSLCQDWHEVGRPGEAIQAVAWTLGVAPHEVLTGVGPLPTSIWDRRVILPDDDRFPRAKQPTTGESIRELLARRNECPDDEGWRIDAMILNLAPRGSA